MPPTDRSWLPVAAVATTLLLWASAFVANRHLGHDFSSGALSLGRLVVGPAFHSWGNAGVWVVVAGGLSLGAVLWLAAVARGSAGEAGIPVAQS